MQREFIDKKISNKKIQILLCGSGRWAQNLYKEISENFHNKSKIFFYTKNKKNLLLWLTKNKYSNFELLKKIPEAKKKNNYAIVVNKNKDHFNMTVSLLKKNYNVLVEKPLICSETQINYLNKLSQIKKKIIIISMQLLYSEAFLKIKNKIKKDKIKILEISWLDKKKEIINNILKKHDYSINFIEDVYYHFYSIITIFLKKNFSLKNSRILKIDFNKLIIDINNVVIKCFFSRDAKKRKRQITILTKLNNKIIINFNNFKNVLVFKNKLKNETMQNFTLKYQIFNFINNNYNKKPLVNDIRNLSIFFENLKFIKNYEKNIDFNTSI
jgi:hypothetical protein